jgi:hypothetical protein
MTLRQILLGAASAVTVLGGAWNGPAVAMELVSDDELAAQRGGYLVADNVVFDFGAVVTTYENGALSLQTQVNWTSQGPQVTQLAGPGVTPLGAAEMGGLTGLGAFQTPGGATIVQNVSDGRILSVLLNSASNLDLRQDTAVTITLPGFAATQAEMLRQQAVSRLANEVAAGSLGAIHF